MTGAASGAPIRPPGRPSLARNQHTAAAVAKISRFLRVSSSLGGVASANVRFRSCHHVLISVVSILECVDPCEETNEFGLAVHARLLEH